MRIYNTLVFLTLVLPIFGAIAINYGDMSHCSKYANRTVVPKGEQKAPTLLWTFPGSGSGWVRLLIEHATGYLSGSVYGDLSLLEHFPGEYMCSKEVALIKAHPTTHDYRELERGFFNHRCKTINRFDKAVMIVRNPYDAIWSDHNRKITRSHVGKILEKDFKKKEWVINAKRLANKYKIMWTESYTPFMKQYPNGYLIIKYEDLMNPDLQIGLLEKIMQFMGHESSSEKMQCAFYLANHPSVKRPSYADVKVMKKSDVYNRQLVCDGLWPIVKDAAGRFDYKPYNGMEC
jgi:hypothetical protein